MFLTKEGFPGTYFCPSGYGNRKNRPEEIKSYHKTALAKLTSEIQSLLKYILKYKRAWQRMMIVVMQLVPS